MERLMELFLYFIGGWMIGWISGYIIAFIKKKKKSKEIPLLTPEEREIYKMLREQYKGLQQAIKEIEDKIG